MTTRLPLVAAQPGIWMAERLSTLPGAWSVAHYVELRGALDPTLLGKAIVAGLQQADTLSLRFEEEEGKSGSGWRPTAPLANRRSLTCVRRRIRIAPPRSGCRRTWRRICVSTAATRWCAISCCASATTAGTGISDITTCWWMASASRR